MNTLKRFIHYYKPHKLIFALDMLAAFLVAIIGMLYPIITRRMISDFVPNSKVNLIIIFSIVLLVIYLIRMGLRYFIQYYGHIMGIRMQATMRSDMFNKLQRLPYTFFDEHETGRIMSRMTNDLFEVAELAHHGPENIFIATFSLLGGFAYLFYINWILSLICLAMVPFVLMISLHYRKKLRDAFRESKQAQAYINAEIESSITGIRVTKAYTNEETEREKFEKSNEAFVTARTKSLSAMGKFFATSQFVTDFFNVVVILAGGLFLVNGIGGFSFADYSAFIVSINLFVSPINQLIQFMEQYHSGSTGFIRFIEVLDEEEEHDDGTAELHDVRGDIKFENVTFSYKTSQSNILKNVSLEIHAGEKIALIGPTGGGKTTICHLIPRFYETTEGKISIDDQDISSLTLRSLRSQIGIVQQDVFLFGGTFRDNIKYGKPDATEEEIISASKKANIYDYIMSLPKGFDTEVGERGIKLSGGQKQRISIARVFLKNPPILILDEATSALDNTTEFLIQNALNELSKGRTSIIVAHRLSTIKNVDRIYVISGGEIVEQGNHETLIQENGIYKSLYDLQFRTDEDITESIISSIKIA